MDSSKEKRLKYIRRTQEARIFSGKKTDEIANFIGIDGATYRSYESRRAMPQQYISDFCEITGVNERWLISGKGRMEADYVEQLEKALRQRISDLRSIIGI